MNTVGKFIFNIILRLIQVVFTIVYLTVTTAYFVSLIVIMPLSWIIWGNKGADAAQNIFNMSYDVLDTIRDWFNNKTS